MKDEDIERLVDLLKTITFDPIACIVLMSNKRDMVGAQLGVEELDPADKVDLVAYLIKHLEITEENIKEAVRLSGETKSMMRMIREGKILLTDLREEENKRSKR